MRKIILSICFPAILLFSIINIASPQEEMKMIDNTIFQKPVRTQAVFPHDIHNEKAGIEDCATCHHKYVNGKLVIDDSSEEQRCYECHSPKTSGKNLSLRKAFHKNCKGCHLKREKGPIMCGECHRKQ